MNGTGNMEDISADTVPQGKPSAWRHRHRGSTRWAYGEEEPTGPSIHLFEVQPLYAASGWQPIDTAPHEERVLLGWDQLGTWFCETGMASHGWRRNGISTMSRHGFATHWMPLPEPPK